MNAAKTERERLATMRRCPKCGAQPYFSCRRYKGITPIALKHPHAEYERLYDLALDADNARWSAERAARHAGEPSG